MSTIVDGLNKLTADATVLYQKLHHYHWNVTGEDFFALHAKFEALYNYFAMVVDSTAERVLTIGGHPPRTLGEMLELANLQEDGGLPDPQGMVKNIVADLEKMIELVRPLAEMADDARDRATSALLDDLIVQAEKDVWMLKAFLKE